MQSYYIGLDIGGTSGRLKLQSKSGQVLGEFTAPGCSINTDGAEKSRLRYRAMVLPVLEKLELKPENCLGICVAASGIDFPSLELSCRESFEEMGFLHERLTVVNDCQVFLYQTEGPSVVVISGTGSICFGRDREGRLYRTGGWNHILSDEGSGFDMGLKTIKAVADHLDGRICCPQFASMLIESTGLNTLEKLNDFVNANLLEKSETARLSLLAYEAAAQGDAQALKIHENCAAAIFSLVKDTLCKMDQGPTDEESGRLSLSGSELNLWLWGSVLVKNDIIREAVTESVKSLYPGIHIRVPETSALDVALQVARKHSLTGEEEADYENR